MEGCQSAFGRCSGPSPPVGVPVGTSTNKCGPKSNGLVCAPGYCCSAYGYCGKSPSYCASSSGCQPKFGTCNGGSPSVSKVATPVPSPTSAPISKDARCGHGYGGQTCKGSSFGNCCSKHNYCGRSDDYCKTGCQSAFGICPGIVPSSIGQQQSASKSASKVASASKSASKTTSKSASKSVSKTASKTASVSASKSVSKSASKSASKSPSPSKSASKSASKASPQSTSKSVSKQASKSVSRSSASLTSFSTESTKVSLASSSTITQVSVGSGTTSSVPVSPSPSTTTGGKNLELLPMRDPSVDRNSQKNFSPSSAVTLYYAEQPGTYTMLIQAKISSGDKAILLENIGPINTITCSDTKITVNFADPVSAALAQTWTLGTILFTLADGCNPSNERGVYAIQTSPRIFRARAIAQTTVDFLVSKTTLQQVVDELDISYGQMVAQPDGKQLASYTTTVTSYFTNSRAGTMTSSVFVSTVTPSLTTMTYTSASITASASASASVSSDSSLVASSTSGDVASSTVSWSLNPSAQAVLNELTASLPKPGPDGTIDLPMKKGNEVVATKPLGAEPYNSDPAYQASLQAIFETDHLDLPETLVSQSADGLGAEDEPNFTPGGPEQLAVSDYQGTDDSVYDAAINNPVTSTTSSSKRQVPARAISAPAPRSAVHSSDLARHPTRSLAKRDGWDKFFDVMGNDLVGEICEVCGAIAAGKELYDAVSCLFGNCPKPPQITITTLTGTTTQEFKLSSKFPANGLVFYDSKATVLCADCNINVSSFKIEGKVVIVAKQLNYPENMVVSAQFTATQSSTASLLFNVRVNGPGAGTFDRVLSTFKLDSITAPGVVTITPKFLYGVGLTYDTAQKIDVQAGAVLTYSGAAADMDVKAKTASNARNWQPQAQITYPKLTTAGRTILTPYIKTDIQLSLNIFGANLENAMVLTTQTNLGFDAQVLSGTEQVAKRGVNAQLHHDASGLSERGLFSSIKLAGLQSGGVAAVIDAARRAALAAQGLTQPPKTVTCNAGSMKLNAVVSTKNQAVIGGKPIPLFDQQTRFGSQCIAFAAPVVSSSLAPTLTPSPSSVQPRSSKTLSSATKMASLTTVTPVASPSAAPANCIASGFVPPAESSCFKVVGHGFPLIEGRYLSMKPGYSTPMFDLTNGPPSTYYLDNSGAMYESSRGYVMSTPYTGGSMWMKFTDIKTAAAEPKAVCTKDASIKGLTCYQTNTNALYVSANYPETDGRRTMPIFGPQYNFVQITMTYEETLCPAKCAEVNAQSSSSTPVMSRAPSSTLQGWPLPPSSTVVSQSKSASITPYASSTVSPTATPSPTPTPSGDDNTMAPCGGLGPNGKKNFYGFDYEIFCGAAGSSPVAAIDNIYLPSFAACINYCTGLATCKAVMFQEIAPNGKNYKCTRYSSLGRPVEGLDWTGTFDVAYRS
ncbi:hypothetical protein NX059_003795 [Plenodomus lindquistii]|nr:hypothetical protein NX059_003795 [Plenodomus lindquistii]